MYLNKEITAPIFNLMVLIVLHLLANAKSKRNCRTNERRA